MLQENSSIELSDSPWNPRIRSTMHKQQQPQPQTLLTKIKNKIKDETLTDKLKNDINKLNKFINEQDLNNYIKQVIEYSFDSNKYFNDSEPWSLKKTDIKKMNSVLNTIVEQIKNISILLLPIIPISAGKILDIINVKKEFRNITEIDKNIGLNHDKELGSIEILFKKVD